MVRLFACKIVEETVFDTIKERMLTCVPEEVSKKALSFYHPNDCQRHLIGDMLARYALNRVSGNRHTLPFPIGEKGKPHPDGYNGVHFNVSHSGRWVVVAVSNDCIGVDIERIRKVPEGVAYRYFSESEKQLLDNAGDEFQKAHIFFTLWTLKESFLKAIGRGLTKSLSSFSIEKNNKGYFLKEDAETSGYNLKVYPFEEGYKLAVCSKETEFDDDIIFLKPEEMIP